MSKHPIFDALHQPLIVALLNTSEPTPQELEALRVLNVFSEGFSGSEVLQVNSQLSLPQIRGRSILKLTCESRWNQLRTEEERYQQLGSLKQVFADLRWSTRIKHPVSGKLYFCSFWQSAQNQAPLAEMQSMNDIVQQDQILRALGLISLEILKHCPLNDIAIDQSFAEVCQFVLGYRCDLIKGKIFRFAQEFLNISSKHPTFNWNGTSLPDPLYYVHHAKALYLLETFYGNAHGDLHPGNVFVSSQKQPTQVCLIDSGLSEHRFPLFYDQAYLEISILLRADFSQNEVPQHWLQMLEALNNEEELGTPQVSLTHSLLPAYVPVYEQIKAIRSAFYDFLQRYQGQSREIRQQYHLMRICAALNYCNKPLPTEQRKFAYLYSAFQIQSFIARYGDDPDLFELKLNLKDNPEYLYQTELREQNSVEGFWRKWSMQNGPQPIIFKELIEDFDRLAFPNTWTPSPLVELFASRFIRLVWSHAYERAESSDEKIALLGILAKALKYQYYPMSIAVKEAQDSFLDVIEQHQAWNAIQIISALHFLEASIEDALFQADVQLFERSSLLMESIVSRCEVPDQIYWNHCLTHARAKWLSLHLNIPELLGLLKNWQPEKDERLNPEWLIKKAMIMASCYSKELSPAFAVMTAGLKQLDLWPFQVQSQFLEAYLILRDAFKTVFTSPPEEAMAKNRKEKGFLGFVEWLRFWEQDRPTREKTAKEGQYQIVWYSQDPAVTDALHAIKGMQVLLRSGHMPMIWHQILISEKAWASINERLFRNFPQLCFFYSMQYLLKNQVAAEWVRLQLQKHLLSQYSEWHRQVKGAFFQQLKQVFNFLQGQDSRMYMLILAVISEFISELPYQDWKHLFTAVWQEFNQPENIKVLYNQTKQGPYLISHKALVRIEEPDLIKSCLETLLVTDGDFDADYYIRPQLLNQMIHNSEFASLSLTPELELAIAANIEALLDNKKRAYALIKLYLIEDMLTLDQQQSIADHILKLERLPGFTRTTIPILIHFTSKYHQARQHLHALMLSETERIWQIGLQQDSNGNWSKSIGSFIYPLHRQKRTATYPEGLSFSEQEIWLIYEALKTSLATFHASPFAQPANRLFGSGLDFTTLKEMNYFLEDYRLILQKDSEYTAIKEDIMSGIHEHAPSSGRPADLIADDPNTVFEGIDHIKNQLREADFDSLTEYWNTLLSKILLQAQPHLLTCLNILSDWLIYYREEAYFKAPFFKQMYEQILERYEKGYPGDSQDHEEIEGYLVDLARVLKYWGFNSDTVQHFINLKQTSVYESVRNKREIEYNDLFVRSLVSDTQEEFTQLVPALWRLDSLSVQGFKSFSSVSMTSVNFKPINLLIGANGSGKSSLLSLFSFVKALVSMPLDSVDISLGQASDFFFYGPKNTSSFSIQLHFQNQDMQLRYSFTCGANQTRKHLVFQEEKITWQSKSSEPKELTNSEIHQDAFFQTQREHPAVKALKACLSSIHAFHFRDTSIDAPFRQAAQLQDNQRLESNARNLAAVLYRMKTQPETEKQYRFLRSVLQRVFRQFDDFILEPDLKNQQILLKWSEVGSDFPFSAHQVSDGTLRFMAMVTLLLQPQELLPRIIILDEPELGLHPTALTILAELLEQVSQYSQLIIATQSGDLLNHFSADDVIVIDRTQMVNGQYLSQYATRLSRKSESELIVWLEDYTLQELWEKNVLGGKP